MDIAPRGACALSELDPRSRVLRRIADTLGVPVEALSSSREPHVLHNAVDGSRWLLVRGAQGKPTVRHITAAGDAETDDSVMAFLIANADSPQHGALVAMIDGLLTAHLAD